MHGTNVDGERTEWNYHNERYLCKELVRVYMNIGDERAILCLNQGTIVEVDSARNVNGNFWVRIKEHPLYNNWRDRIEGKWFCAQQQFAFPTAIPLNHYYFVDNGMDYHTLYELPSFDSNCLPEVAVNNIIVEKSVQNREFFFGNLHEQTLTCFGIDPHYTWIVVRDYANLFFRIVHTPSFVCYQTHPKCTL